METSRDLRHIQHGYYFVKSTSPYVVTIWGVKWCGAFWPTANWPTGQTDQNCKLTDHY